MGVRMCRSPRSSRHSTGSCCLTRACRTACGRCRARAIRGRGAWLSLAGSQSRRPSLQVRCASPLYATVLFKASPGVGPYVIGCRGLSHGIVEVPPQAHAACRADHAHMLTVCQMCLLAGVIEASDCARYTCLKLHAGSWQMQSSGTACTGALSEEAAAAALSNAMQPLSEVLPPCHLLALIRAS